MHAHELLCPDPPCLLVMSAPVRVHAHVCVVSAAKDRDWGLQELGRGFKGGTLRIAPLKKQGEGSGGAGGGPRRSRPVNINPVRAGKGKGEKGKGKKPKGLPF